MPCEDCCPCFIPLLNPSSRGQLFACWLPHLDTRENPASSDFERQRQSQDAWRGMGITRTQLAGADWPSQAPFEPIASRERLMI